MGLGVWLTNTGAQRTVAGCPKGKEEENIQIPEPVGISTGPQLGSYIAILFYQASLSTPTEKKNNPQIELISNQ